MHRRDFLKKASVAVVILTIPKPEADPSSSSEAYAPSGIFGRWPTTWREPFKVNLPLVKQE